MLARSRQTAVIATLGTEAQVVTVTLDLLIEQLGLVVDELVIVHTVPRPGFTEDRIAQALATLKQELAEWPRYKAFVRHVDWQPLLRRDAPLHDVRTEDEAGAAFTAIYRQVLKHKRARRVVHLNVSGGRKGIIMYGMAAAQILFDDDDRLWLLSSSEAFERSRALHRHIPSDAQLTPIPVLQWREIPTSLTPLMVYEDPFEAIKYQRRAVGMDERQHREQFLTALKEENQIKYRIIELLATVDGITNPEIAKDLSTSVQVVANYLRDLYPRIINEFGLRPDIRGKREIVTQVFAPHFEQYSASTS